MATRKKKKRIPRKPSKTAGKKPDNTSQAQSDDGQENQSQPEKNKADSQAPGKKPRKNVNRIAAKKKTGRRSARRRTPARKKAALKKSVGQTIHCTIALTGGQSMLLPTSAIAEITDYAPPSPLDDSPEWLLGQVEWEDWQVPVISYGALIESQAPESATGRSRIMVVKSLSNTTRVPFIGVLVSEIPKLAKLAEDDLDVTSEKDDAPSVHCTVKLTGMQAVIPDLDRLGQLVGHAAYGTVDKEGTTAQA